MLDSPELRTLMVEIHDDLAQEVGSLLARHGFALEERHPAAGCWYGLFRR
jgi:hypothetical protein